MFTICASILVAVLVVCTCAVRLLAAFDPFDFLVREDYGSTELNFTLLFASTNIDF